MLFFHCCNNGTELVRFVFFLGHINYFLKKKFIEVDQRYEQFNIFYLR